MIKVVNQEKFENELDNLVLHRCPNDDNCKGGCRECWLDALGLVEVKDED